MSVADETADGTRNTGDADAPRTWADVFPSRPKPDETGYGYLSPRGEVVRSTREGLIDMAHRRALPPLVWAPETDAMVPPWRVPFLLDAMRETVARGSTRERQMFLAGAAVVVGLFWFALPSGTALVLTLIVIAFLAVQSQVRRSATPRQISAEDFERNFEAVLAQQDEESQPSPATHALAVAITAATALQLLYFTPSLEAASLEAGAVARGEWWRLLTAPMLHGGIIHYWFNIMAVLSLGRTMEARGPRPWVPLVFLVTALAGGIFSLYLPPYGRSIGASGGLMGMFGFLAVMAHRRKQHLPEGFLKSLMINIGLIAVMGIVAYRFIDNAAHAGGLIAGLAIGAAVIPPGEVVWSEARPALRWAGHLATAIIFLSAALAIALTLGAAR